MASLHILATNTHISADIRTAVGGLFLSSEHIIIFQIMNNWGKMTLCIGQGRKKRVSDTLITLIYKLRGDSILKTPRTSCHLCEFERRSTFNPMCVERSVYWLSARKCVREREAVRAAARSSEFTNAARLGEHGKTSRH